MTNKRTYNFLSTVNFKPFISSELSEYLTKYPVLIVSKGSNAYQNNEMCRICSWYAVKHKMVILDHHPHRNQLITQLYQEMLGTSAPRYKLATLVNAISDKLPVIFVKQKYIGSLKDLLKLQKEKKLKDLLQFGFLWKDIQTSSSSQIKSETPQPIVPAFHMNNYSMSEYENDLIENFADIPINLTNKQKSLTNKENMALSPKVHTVDNQSTIGKP